MAPAENDLSDERTVAYWIRELDRAGDRLLDVEGDVRNLADKLAQAEKNLSGPDFKIIQAHMMARFSFTKADIKAYIDMSLGKLDPRLLLAGAKSSKIMNMSRDDQDRLLTEEVFEVYDNTGQVREVTWAHMRFDERGRLIGRNGAILPLLRQKRPEPNRIPKTLDFDGGYINRRISAVSNGEHSDTLVLTSTEGSRRSAIPLSDLKNALAEDEVEYLVEFLTA